jgi:hypothetical protein
MFTRSSRPVIVGDEIIAALFGGPELRDADALSAFARRASQSPEGRIGAPR